jgi:5-formyltetrahydrofolate cyclo-ligase
MDIPAQKRALRAKTLAARRALSADERAAKSRQICAHITALPDFENAKTVMGYMPLADEADVRPAMTLALEAGKRLALPQVDRENRVIIARAVGDLSAAVCAGYQGILEPRTSAPMLAVGEIDLIIMPAAAADKNGYRLGYGGGFYDRFTANARARKIAAIFCRQLASAVPHDARDVRTDAIVCERGALWIQNK